MKRIERCACLLAQLLAACVLPDYHVEEAAVSKPSEVLTVLPGAPAECQQCLASECQSQHRACGEHCADFRWPLSPAWQVTDHADPFVKCAMSACSDQCKVLWGCVNKYTWNEPGEAYDIAIRVVDPISDATPVGIRVSACRGSDPACAETGGRVVSGTTDDAGLVTLNVPGDFFGFFLVEPGPDYLPITQSWSQPGYRADTTFTLGIYSKSWVDDMAESLMVKRRDDAAQVIFRAQNCLPLRYFESRETEAAAEDVVVSYTPNDASSPTFYTGAALAVRPGATATSHIGFGYGGAFNLEPGAIAISGSYEGDEVSGTVLRVRAGTLGLAYLLPNSK
jgi:hypothetical protein